MSGEQNKAWLAVLLKSSLIKDTSTEQMRSSAPTPSSTSLPHLDSRLVWRAFPDLHSTVEDTIAEGD